MAESATSAILKVLMSSIFVLWVSLWIVKPTGAWTRAWRRAEDSAKNTFFGYYGLNFAVLSFPVIALAILGIINVAFQPKQPQRRKSRTLYAFFSNPVTINAFVGIVSFSEILVVFLFVVFLVWTFYARISNDFSKLTPVESMNLNLWQLKYLRIATRFGLLAEACLALLLLPVLRGLSVFRMIGIQLESSVRYHIWLGTAMICFAAFHGGSTLLVWGTSHYIEDQVWRWQRKGRIYLAGEIALVTGLVMFLTSLPRIRRKRFEVFYYTHHLYVIFLLFFLFHAGDRHFYWVFPGIFLFGLDKLLRIIQSRSETHIVTARVFPNEAAELVLPKDPRLTYSPSSVLFVNVPSVSRFQWHPFSISSSSMVDYRRVSFMIKCEGTWTTSLYNMIQSKLCADSDRRKRVVVRVEGPYGPASLGFLRFERLILVAGGIGITPFLSILNEISCARSKQRNLKIQLVFIVRSTQDISQLTPISSLILKPVLHLKLKVFITREKGSTSSLQELLSDSSAQTRTVHFEAEGHQSHGVKGTESPWCLAAIISVSSLVFFVCLVWFNHVFVRGGTKKRGSRPSMKLSAASSKKRTAKENSPSWIVDLIIVSCFAISVTCGALLCIFLRWRRTKMEDVPDVKGGEIDTQRSSESTACGVEEHEVHYGERPDFEAILSEFQDAAEGLSETGVVVCGPESMKRSMARACRSKSRCLGTSSEPKRQLFLSFHSLNFNL